MIKSHRHLMKNNSSGLIVGSLYVVESVCVLYTRTYTRTSKTHCPTADIDERISDTVSHFEMPQACQWLGRLDCFESKTPLFHFSKH